MTTLADAIAKLEGYGVSNSIPTIANNPGSLELGDLGNGTLAAANGQNITIFPTAQDGWNALNKQLQLATQGNSAYYTPDTTLQQFGTTYSGGNPTYGANLASALGVDPNTTLAQVAGQNQSSLPQSSWSDIARKALGMVTPQTLIPSPARAIMIVIGLLLIAAGLFSFKQTQVVIQTAAKTAAKVAA